MAEYNTNNIDLTNPPVNRVVWTYWERKNGADIPPLIDLCIRSIIRNNPTAVCIGPEDVLAWEGGKEIMERTQDAKLIPFRADAIRLWLLEKFGGVWVDADTVCTSRIDLIDVVPDHDLIGVVNRFQKGQGLDGILATPYGARQGSPAMQVGLRQCLRDLDAMKEGIDIMYGATSVGLLSRLWKTRRSSFVMARREHWKYNRIPWFKARNTFKKVRPFKEFENGNLWGPNIQTYHLTNVVPDQFKDKTEDELLTGPWFLSFILQKAFALRPAITGRASEILKRLPRFEEVRGVEVGVLQGVNSLHLLQQQRQLHLTCVDLWGLPVPASFHNTGDYMSKWTPKRWEQVFNNVQRRLQFAVNAKRVDFIRAASVEAAEQFEDGSLDFVFIDADHSFQGCHADVEAWFPKVKPGGWIGGHDFNHPKNKSGVYGVNKAVNRLIERLDADQCFCEFCCGKPRPAVETGIDWTWFVRKPQPPQHGDNHEDQKEN